MHKYTPGQKCSFTTKGRLRFGRILITYEEIGGANDGQTYISIKEDQSKKTLHIKDSDIVSTVNKV
jgi:hypothetical protein